jgi:segregation and condensation protein B
LEEERLKAILESLLFAAAEPVALAQLVTVLETVAREDVKKALGEMAVAYGAGGRGIVLEEVAGGYQLRTPKEHALYVRKLLAAKPPRLSRPLLETVAIIAYRQPITRPEIEQLRGVDCGGVLDTLVERRLAKIAGRKEAPGRPIMYETTTEFLELFGLKDLGGLPDLEELRLIENPREVALFAREDGADPADAADRIDTADDSTGMEIPESAVASEIDEGSSGEETVEAPGESGSVEDSANSEAAATETGAAPASDERQPDHDPATPAGKPEDHD